MEQTGDILKPVPENPSPIPSKKIVEHIVEKLLPPMQKEKCYPFIVVLKVDFLHDPLLHPSPDSADIGRTVTDIWPKYIQDHSIRSHYH